MIPVAQGSRTAALVARAEKLFPGGVNSPVRAFGSVGRPPLVLAGGSGPHVRDADGRTYIDYIGAWGPAILGHGDPAVVAAITAAAADGCLSRGAERVAPVGPARRVRRRRTRRGSCTFTGRPRPALQLKPCRSASRSRGGSIAGIDSGGSRCMLYYNITFGGV